MRHGFALLWRVVLAVLAAIIGLVLVPSAVAGGEQQVPVVATYAYDAHCPFDAPGDTTTERGPPATDDVHTACDTVDRRSHGASAYADGSTTCPGTTYAHTSAAVPVALATTTTSGDGEVADGDLSMLSGARSAAKSARYGPHNPGPLDDAIASTFRSSSYTASELSRATTLYRVYGGQAGKLGSYWSRTKPSGPLQSQLDSALNPAWGNSASNVATIRVPSGTTIYEGAAASQPIAGGGSLLGGGSQVFIPRVSGSWLVP